MNDDTHDLADYRRKVKQLRENYLQRTRSELSQLRTLLDQAHNGDGTAQQELLLLIHRAHGSGAVLEFERISAIAHEMEYLLRNLEDTAVSDAAWQQLTGYLEEFAAALQVAQP